MKLQVKLYKNSTETAESAPYLGRMVTQDVIKTEAVCQGIAELSRLTKIQVRAIIEGAFDLFASLEREAPTRIHLDGFYLEEVITGSFASSDAAFDPDKNKLEIAIRSDAHIRNHLVDEVAMIVTDETSTKVRLDNVADTTDPRPYQVIHGQNPARATGLNLVTTDDGFSCYLMDRNGVKYPCSVVDVVSRQEFTFRSNELLDGGDYKFVVESRGGDATGDIQQTFRNIKYLHIVPPTPEPQVSRWYSDDGENKIKVGYDCTIEGELLDGFTSVTIYGKDMDGNDISTNVVGSVSEDGTKVTYIPDMGQSPWDYNSPATVKVKKQGIDEPVFTSPAQTWVS